MSAVGLGKGLPAPSCWKLHPLCGGMERGPETPPQRSWVPRPSNPQGWAGSLQPGPPSLVCLGGGLAGCPSVLESLCSTTHGLLPLLREVGVPWRAGGSCPSLPRAVPVGWSHPIPQHRALLPACDLPPPSAPTLRAGAGLGLGARIDLGSRTEGRKGPRVCVGSGVLPGGLHSPVGAVVGGSIGCHAA